MGWLLTVFLHKLDPFTPRCTHLLCQISSLLAMTVLFPPRCRTYIAYCSWKDQQTLSRNVSRGRKPLGVNIYRLLLLSCCADNRVPLPPFGARQMSPRLHQGATYINTLLTAPHLDASRHIGRLHRDSKPPQAWKGAKISPLHALGGSVSTGNPVHAWLRRHKQITP